MNYILEGECAHHRLYSANYKSLLARQQSSYLRTLLATVVVVATAAVVDYCLSLLRPLQVNLQVKHISISEYTSNSTLATSIIICCCCCCCRSRRAECCIVQFGVLELVEDAYLLRGRFAAS